MSGETGIEWCDCVWNVLRGCSMAKGSEAGGCLNCYAAKYAARYPWGKGYARTTENGPRWTGVVDFLPDKLGWPLRFKGHKDARAEGRPTRIFVNSTSDLFHEKARFQDIAAVYGVMAYSEHEFIVLTKRPERRLAFYRWMSELQGPDDAHGNRPFSDMSTDPILGCEIQAERRGVHIAQELGSDGKPNGHRKPRPAWPLRNVIEGVSVEDQKTADLRVPILMRTPAARRLVSYEPALGPVDFRALVLSGGNRPGDTGLTVDAATGLHTASGFHVDELPPPLGPIHWLIVGGESGPGARPFLVRWAWDMRRQFYRTGVALFVKQMGRWLVGDHAGFAIDRWRCADGRIWVPPILGERAFARPNDAEAFTLGGKGGDPSEWPEDLRVREFPRSAA